MLSVKLLKKYKEETNFGIYLSKKVMSYFIIENRGPYIIKFGCKEAVARVIRDHHFTLDNDVTPVYLTKLLRKRIGLPKHINAIQMIIKGEKLALGPVVGVLVNPRFYQAILDGEPPTSCEEMFRANQAAGTFLYYFSIENFKWLERLIKGVYLDEEGQPHTRWLPLPDIVYDRGVNFYAHEKPVIKEIRKQLRMGGYISFINSVDGINKLTFFLALQRDKDLAQFLPETVLMEDFDLGEVMALLNKYGIIFLKDIFSNRGRGIIAISMHNGTISASLAADDHIKTLELENKYELKYLCQNFFGEKKILVQQGIRLLQFQKKNFDMRILVIKNSSGEWTTITNEARVSRENSLLTNASLGAEIHGIHTVLKNNGLPESQISAYDQHARSISIKVAACLESYLGPMGEMGLDLCFDRDFKLWFLEGNAKPDKDPEHRLQNPEDIAPQFLLTLEYAKYLWQNNFMIIR